MSKYIRYSFMCIVLAIMVHNHAMVHAQKRVPQWISDGPFIEERLASFEVPLKFFASKLYVEIEIGGKLRRFVVDTGSPSMVDTALAKDLELDVVGTSKGKDAHGVVVKSDVVQTTIKLGGVSFHKVPMFLATFSASEAAKFLIGDGVLGSEVLALGAWQIDVKNSVLRFNTEVSRLPFIKNSKQSRLYDFGYPHAPIFDVQFAKKARSKAMFDTGSPTYFAISPDDFEGAKRGGGIGRILSGYGSSGSSLGGQAPNSDQLQAELKTLFLGEIALGRVGAIRRESSPSLIGAKLLEHFVVTFDSKSGVAYFTKYNDGPLADSSFGFSLAFNEGISVALVWDKSAAAMAGLCPGMALTSINGKETELSNEGIQSAISALQGNDIHLEWIGGSATLTQKLNILEK